MFHIVYKTIRKSTGEYYIGVHSTKNLNDKYMGSGDRIKRIVSKHGKADLERITLYECSTRKEALTIEFNLLTKNVLADPACLNTSVGGKGTSGGGHGISDEARIKLSNLKLGVPKSEETKRRMSVSFKGRPSKLKGVPRSEATRQKISASSKGKIISAETRQKLSDRNKEVWRARKALQQTI